MGRSGRGHGGQEAGSLTKRDWRYMYNALNEVVQAGSLHQDGEPDWDRVWEIYMEKRENDSSFTRRKPANSMEIKSQLTTELRATSLSSTISQVTAVLSRAAERGFLDLVDKNLSNREGEQGGVETDQNSSSCNHPLENDSKERGVNIKQKVTGGDEGSFGNAEVVLRVVADDGLTGIPTLDVASPRSVGKEGADVKGPFVQEVDDPEEVCKLSQISPVLMAGIRIVAAERAERGVEQDGMAGKEDGEGRREGVKRFVLWKASQSAVKRLKVLAWKDSDLEGREVGSAPHSDAGDGRRRFHNSCSKGMDDGREGSSVDPGDQGKEKNEMGMEKDEFWKGVNFEQAFLETQCGEHSKNFVTVAAIWAGEKELLKSTTADEAPKVDAQSVIPKARKATQCKHLDRLLKGFQSKVPKSVLQYVENSFPGFLGWLDAAKEETGAVINITKEPQ